MARLLKITLLALTVGAVWVLWPSAQENVEACGGFFCSTTPIDQNAERIIFTINGDGTITAIVGINYVGEAEDFSWVVPVPSIPELDVADQDIFRDLQNATNPQFILPNHYCIGLITSQFSGGMEGGAGGGGGFYGQIGPYEYAILGSDDPNELIGWLREHNYQVTDDMEPIIADYVEAGMYFLAMRLSQDAVTGDIQPIVMTYEAENPMIPIKLTAIAAIENMPIYVWIFGETQYVPANYAHPTVDYNRYKIEHAIGNMGSGITLTPIQAEYSAQLRQFQSTYEGKAFVTDYAGSTSGLLAIRSQQINLMSSIRSPSFTSESRDELQALFTTYPYLTRLYGQMSPDQMTLDPIFVPDSDAPDVSVIVDFREFVFPLAFWGCTTRSISEDFDSIQMPDSTYFEQWDLDIAHPEGWMLSEFDLVAPPSDEEIVERNSHVWILSPESVTQETITNYFAGQSMLPMFVMIELTADEWFAGQLNHYERGRSHQIRQYLYDPTFDGANFADPGLAFVGFRHLRPTDETLDPLMVDHVLLFAVFTSDEDGDTNRAVYNVMIDSASQYDFFLHPELEYTLFLTGNLKTGNMFRFSDTLIRVPYPDGWIEEVGDNDEIIIAPEERDLIENQPYVHLIPYETWLDFESGTDWDRNTWRRATLDYMWEPVVEGVSERYGLEFDEDFTHILLRFARCNEPINIFTFENELRQGFLQFSHGYVIEISAPRDMFAEYESVLGLINQSLTTDEIRRASCR